MSCPQVRFLMGAATGSIAPGCAAHARETSEPPRSALRVMMIVWAVPSNSDCPAILMMLMKMEVRMKRRIRCTPHQRKQYGVKGEEKWLKPNCLRFGQFRYQRLDSTVPRVLEYGLPRCTC